MTTGFQKKTWNGAGHHHWSQRPRLVLRGQSGGGPTFRFCLYPELPLSLGLGPRVWRALREFRPEVLHASSPGFMAVAAVAYSRWLQCPLLISYHTHVPKYIDNYFRGCFRPLARASCGVSSDWCTAGRRRCRSRWRRSCRPTAPAAGRCACGSAAWTPTCSGLPASYTRLVDVILPAISNKPMRTLSNVVGDRPAVCFPKLFVGGAVPLFRLPKEPLLEGREELLMGFRNAVVESVRVVPALPRVPTILITHKTYSMWAKHTPWHRVIHNAVELRQFIAEAFPEAVVELVEWHHLPFAQQLQKLGHTSVLITPCGGVSMILPFLPDGAHAIVMDYLSTGSRDDPWGYQAGESASMEITLWNRFPHVTKYYYQVFNHSDLVFDYNGTRDTRNDASIRVDFRRMQRLLLSALSTMGYTVTPHDS